MADLAHHSPAQGPLASGSDADAFAASILVEPGAAEAQEPPAELSQPPADAAESGQPAASPGPQPTGAGPDEPVTGRGAAEEPAVVDTAVMRPASLPDEPAVPHPAPAAEPAAGDRESPPPSEPDAAESEARLGQPGAVTAEASHRTSTTAAEPDPPPAPGLEQPPDPESVPSSPPHANLALGIPLDIAEDAQVEVPPEMAERQAEWWSGEPAMSQEEPPTRMALPEPLAAAEAVPDRDREAWHDHDAVVPVGVEAGSIAGADVDRGDDAAAGSATPAPLADGEANLQHPGHAADADPLPAEERAQPAGADPAAVDHVAVPDSAGGPEAAEQGGGTATPETAPAADHVPHATNEAANTAEPDSHPPAAAGGSVFCMRGACCLTPQPCADSMPTHSHTLHGAATAHPSQVQLLLCADQVAAYQAATVDPAAAPHSSVSKPVTAYEDAMLQPADASQTDGQLAGDQQLLPDLNFQPA